jgi:hypothetical protein
LHSIFCEPRHNSGHPVELSGPSLCSEASQLSHSVYLSWYSSFDLKVEKQNAKSAILLLRLCFFLPHISNNAVFIELQMQAVYALPLCR